VTVKQLTILCSSDLSDTVRGTLVEAGAEGFLEIPNAVGNKPGAASEFGRYPRWEAEMFLAPVTTEVAERVVKRLRDHAGTCEVEPCLRILVSPVEAVY
jgi:hypothetical protein